MNDYNLFDSFSIPDETCEWYSDSGRLSRLRELVNEIEEMDIPDAMLESAIACLEELLDDAGK